MAAARISLTGSARKTANTLSDRKERQDKDQRDQQDQFSQACKKQTDLCLSECHKTLLAANLKSNGKNTCHINPQSPGGVLDQIRGIGEHSGKYLRYKKQNSPAQGHKKDAGFKLGKKVLLPAFS